MGANIKKVDYNQNDIFNNVKDNEVNYNDNKVLDALTLNSSEKKIGIIKSLIFTTIAVFIFFVPINIGTKTDITFGFIYRSIESLLGIFGVWIICVGIIVSNGLLSIYGKFICKKENHKIVKYYEEDSIIHVILYIFGAVVSSMYVINLTFGTKFPEIIISPHTSGAVVPVAISVAWIIPVSSLFMPFLLNYGIIDFVGSLMEPFMRPIFKVPGRSAVNAIASFVSSSSVGVLITSKLYRNGVYTKKEATIIATGFSAVSVGFAYMVIDTAGLAEKFIPIYFTAMLITLLVSFFMSRIPPLSKMPSTYEDERVQTKEDLRNRKSEKNGIIKTGLERAIKKAYVAPNLGKEILTSLSDGYFVLPKVVSLLTAVGTLAMIIANYTPIFNWIGYGFEPILRILQVPDAAIIAPSLPVGIAEMFLPVLMIADKIDILTEASRYFVVTVSMVQIIFFSETVVVIMSTKIPISLKQLIICFILRTLIAIPITALFMHLIF